MDLEEDTQSDLQKIIKQSLNIIDGIEIDDESLSSENTTPQRVSHEEVKFTQNRSECNPT